jgi:hypothetical protein
MGKEQFEPNFDLESVSGIAKYVKYYIEEYYSDPSRNGPEVLEKLKVVFTNAKYHGIILKGNDFCTVFRQRLGKRRLGTLKQLLMKIDSVRYDPVHY